MIVVTSVSLETLELRIERVAQRIGEQAERGDEQRHRRCRRDELPPLAEDQLFCASFSIEPHDTTSTGTPKPRNDRITST